MKSVFFIFAMLFILKSYAQLSPASYTHGGAMTYAELESFLKTTGLDKAYYSHSTGLSMSFTLGKVTVNGVPKKTLFYHWKSYKLIENQNGNVLTDDSALLKPNISSGGATPNYITVDTNSGNLVYDFDAINPMAKNSLEKLIGFRAIIFENDSATSGLVGRVKLNPTSQQIEVIVSPHSMGFDKQLINGILTSVKVNAPGVTGPHLLDVQYNIKNYSDKINGVQF